MSNIIEQVLQTNIYIQPIYFILIIFINILNIRILCCRVLRSSPCTHYFLAYAIFSIIYACLLCPTQFLRGFSIFWAAHGTIPCKIHFYILFTVPYQANLMLILASFDRYCSSLNLRRFFHSKSTVRIARIVIILGTVCCVLYMLPILVIYNLDADSKKCRPKSNLIINIYILSQVVFYYILAPLLMIVFGLLTIANIRRQSARARFRISNNRSRRTEGQLTRMLLLQVGVHLILAVPFGITYSMNSFIPSTQTSRVLAIRLAFVTWQQCDYFISFFLYVLSGSVYRQQLIRIIKSIQRPNPSIRSVTQRPKGVYRELPIVTGNIQLTKQIHGVHL